MVLFLENDMRLTALTFAASLILPAIAAQGTTLRIATYNLEADVASGSGTGSLGTGLETVLEGLGEVHLSDNGTAHAQPLDVLAVEELSTASNGMTQLASIVSSLNTTYGAGTYAYATTVDTTTGGQGGGPSGLIYNTKTVSLISGKTLSAASGSGAPRSPLEFTLQAVGYGSASTFYVDVSHAKSGTDSDSADRRNDEATTLVNEATTLGSSAHIVSVGDFNITGTSTETTYKTMIAKFKDVGNPANNWKNTSAFSALMSESAVNVEYRDDIQFVSSAAANASGVNGLQYDAGSYSVFGNGGSSLLLNDSVDDTTNNPGALSDLSLAERTAILSALTTASDHLPVVADYDIVGVSLVPEPTSLAAMSLGAWAMLKRRRRLTPCQ